MRIVFAPDSFKGSISATGAAEALAAGWQSVRPGDEVVLRPMADGGEGTVEAFATAIPDATLKPITVPGPHGRDVETHWLLLPDGTAVIDLASTSGIELLGEERRPWDADTTGFGQAIAAALDHGVSRLVLGIGSSASTDGGLGLLTALGARFADATGTPIRPGARGLIDVDTVDRTGLRPCPEVLVLTDVTNPLTGPQGAASVFGPQKGLTESADIARVDAALANLAELLSLDTATPGAGAAGGVGGALLVWGAHLVPGAEEVATLIGLPGALADADVVVTGEGSYDGQSGDGKVPSFVAGLAGKVTPLLVAGRITPDADRSLFAASLSLIDLAGSSEAAMTGTAHWLREAGAALARRASG